MIMLHVGERHMGQALVQARDGDLLKVLALLGSALEILDAVDAAPNVGGHIDLAICRLREILQAELEAEHVS
jgi:hypothetical protein